MSQALAGRLVPVNHAHTAPLVAPLALDQLLTALTRQPFALTFTFGAITMSLSTSTPRPNSNSGPLFPLGRLVATPHALQVLETHRVDPLILLQRHVSGDWGELDPVDRQTNDDALQHGDRLFSSYHLTTEVRVWVITEADRSVTTLLMPEDY